METEEDYPVLESERVRAARQFALQRLGDSSWADLILWSYNNPKRIQEILKIEREEKIDK